MSVLGIGLGFIHMEGAVIVVLPVAGGDKLGGGSHGFVAESDGVGTHIGDETQGPFPFHVHALIELLGNGHGPLGGHVQLPGSLLLEGGGGKRRRGGALLLRLLHIGHRKLLTLDVPKDLIRLGLVFQIPLLVLSIIVGQEGAGAAHTVQRYIDRPVLLGLEGPDLLLPVHHHPGGHALDTSGGKAPADLFPQQRGQLVAHDPVQDPSCLLGIHQVIVDLPGMLDGILHHLLGDLVEGHPVGLFLRQVQQLLQVPGDGLSLPVRVRCQIDGIRVLGGGFQLLDQRLFAPDGQIFRREVMLQIHAHAALRQIPQMAHAGLHHIVGAQILADGFCFGRRLNDHQIVGFAHEILPFPGEGGAFALYLRILPLFGHTLAGQAADRPLQLQHGQ